MNRLTIGRFSFHGTAQAVLRFGALVAFALVGLNLWAPRAAAATPCCQITAINQQTGIVSAKVNASGQTFEFAVTNRALLQSLKFGQGVYANFKTNQVSVDGVNPCCQIVGAGNVKPAPTPPTAGNTTASPGPAVQARPTPCCQIATINQQTAMVTAKVTATSQPFEFKVPNPGLLQSLKVGQGVYANFKTQQVSLDSEHPCCTIVNLGAAQPLSVPAITGGPTPGQKPVGKVFSTKPCCQVTNVALQTSGLGIAGGIATARINFSGQTFQFKLTEQSLLSLFAALRAGKEVYANFKTLHVSLDGNRPCCQIAALGPKPATPPPTTANPPHLPLKPSGAGPMFSAQLRPHALSQALPQMQASGGAGVAVANELIRIPWNGGLADQYAKLAKKTFSEYVVGHLGTAGQPIAQGKGSVGLDIDTPLGQATIGADWYYTLTLVQATPYVDLSSGPPGFLYASLTGEGGSPPGFVARAPLNGSWNLGATAGVLVLKAGIEDSFGDSLDWSVQAISLSAAISNFSVTAGAQLDNTDPDRPILARADISPQFTLSIATQVAGAPVNNIQVPIALTLEAQPGSVALKGHFASASIFPTEFHFPVNTRLTGDTALTIRPSDASGDITATASLTGYLEVDLLNPITGRNLKTVNIDLAALNIPFDVPRDINLAGLDIALLSPDILAQLTAVFGPLPATWPPAAGSVTSTPVGYRTPPGAGKNVNGVSYDMELGGVTPPPPNPLPDFAGAAQQLEAAMPRHLPYGAILQLDRKPGLYVPEAKASKHISPFSYSRLADSAIFTGHYLAAESFRYAATNDPAALARVQVLLKGIQLLFDVTKDAVGQNCGGSISAIRQGLSVDVRNCQFVPVPAQTAGRILARSVLPSNSASPYTLDHTLRGFPPDMVRDHDGKTPCFYILPEGGWAVGNNTYPTLADAIKHNPNLQANMVGQVPQNRQSVLNPLPVGPAQTVSPNRNPLAGFGPVGQISLKALPVGTIWYGVGCGKGHDDDVVSRDQYIGIMMGLAFAYALVPPVQIEAGHLVNTALSYIVQNSWNLPAPPAESPDIYEGDPPQEPIFTTFIGEFDYQLEFLRIGATVDPLQWGPLYQQYQSASALTWIGNWITTFDPMNNCFQFNLGHGSFSPLLFLEQSDSAVRQNMLAAYRIMRRATATHRNPYFDLVRILIEPQAQRGAVASAPAPSNPNISLNAEIVSLLSEWLVRWATIQQKEGTSSPFSLFPNSPFPSDLVPNPQDIEWLWTPPRPQVARYLGLNSPNCQVLSTFALPLESRPGDRNYLWEDSPFDTGVPCPDYLASVPPQEKIPSTPDTEGAAVDYLLAYWMAVYLGILQ